MSSNGQHEAKKLRASLKHPIIDADGHWAEFAPHMREEFRRIGGDTAVEALALASARIPNSLNMSVAERRRRRIGQEAFWFLPTKNTLDRATAMLPRLLYERLDDLRLDCSVITASFMNACTTYSPAGGCLSYFLMKSLRQEVCLVWSCAFSSELQAKK